MRRSISVSIPLCTVSLSLSLCVSHPLTHSPRFSLSFSLPPTLLCLRFIYCIHPSQTKGEGKRRSRAQGHPHLAEWGGRGTFRKERPTSPLLPGLYLSLSPSLSLSLSLSSSRPISLAPLFDRPFPLPAGLDAIFPPPAARVDLGFLPHHPLLQLRVAFLRRGHDVWEVGRRRLDWLGRRWR